MISLHKIRSHKPAIREMIPRPRNAERVVGNWELTSGLPVVHPQSAKCSLQRVASGLTGL
jgi:hypothetical protein